MTEDLPDLTQQDWEDIAYMAECFRLNFEQHPAFTKDEDTKRRLALARRLKVVPVRIAIEDRLEGIGCRWAGDPSHDPNRCRTCREAEG